MTVDRPPVLECPGTGLFDCGRPGIVRGCPKEIPKRKSLDIFFCNLGGYFRGSLFDTHSVPGRLPLKRPVPGPCEEGLLIRAQCKLDDTCVKMEANHHKHRKKTKPSPQPLPRQSHPGAPQSRASAKRRLTGNQSIIRSAVHSRCQGSGSTP